MLSETLLNALHEEYSKSGEEIHTSAYAVATKKVEHWIEGEEIHVGHEKVEKLKEIVNDTSMCAEHQGFINGGSMSRKSTN